MQKTAEILKLVNIENGQCTFSVVFYSFPRCSPQGSRHYKCIYIITTLSVAGITIIYIYIYIYIIQRLSRTLRKTIEALQKMCIAHFLCLLISTFLQFYAYVCRELPSSIKLQKTTETYRKLQKIYQTTENYKKTENNRKPQKPTETTANYRKLQKTTVNYKKHTENHRTYKVQSTYYRQSQTSTEITQKL